MTPSRSLRRALPSPLSSATSTTAHALIDRALVLNPNLAAAWIFSGWVKVWLGEPEMAIEREARAMRLSPHDPQIFNMQAATAAAHFFAGRYAEALSWAEMSIREQPDFIPSTVVAAASAALAGNHAAAGESHGTLAPTHARAAHFQSQGPVADPASGRFRSMGGRHAKSWPAGMNSRGGGGVKFAIRFGPGGR